MKILITGGAGFIGSHIADACLKAGFRTHIVDNLTTGSIKNVPEEATFHQLDIRNDAVERLWKQERYTILIHAAAQMNVRKSVEDPIMDADINVLGSLNLLEAGRKYGLRQVIFSSTGGAIYGEPQFTPQDENHPVLPVSPYGITKHTLENYLHYYTNEYDIQSVSLRYSNVFGPRQNSKGEAGVVAIFTEKLLNGEQCVINGNGEQTRDYVYVDDVVQANMKAINAKKSETYNVGTGVETSVNKLYHKIRYLINPDAEAQHGPAMPGEQQRSVIDAGKLSRELKWEQNYSLDKGLKKTVEWFKSRPKSSDPGSDRLTRML